MNAITFTFFEDALINCQLHWHRNQTPSREQLIEWMRLTLAEMPRLRLSIEPLVEKLAMMSEDDYWKKLATF